MTIKQSDGKHKGSCDMGESTQWTIDGQRGHISVREWPNEHALWLAVLAHGYGEHIGRYDHVAQALRQASAAVVGPDYRGHGTSDGERAVIEDFEEVITDLHAVTLGSNKSKALAGKEVATSSSNVRGALTMNEGNSKMRSSWGGNDSEPFDCPHHNGKVEVQEGGQPSCRGVRVFDFRCPRMSCLPLTSQTI